MSDPRYPTLADWRALALGLDDAVNLLGDPDFRSGAELELCALTERRDALLAAEDQHPPTVHVWATTSEWVPTGNDPNGQVVALVKQWRWNMREANGRIIATAGESFVDKSHAVAMARRIAGALGGRVIDDDTGEDITEPTTEVE